ncbi:MAG: DNA polymerase III subunit delta [Nitrospirae bacterium]|nr:MAG: DNA polymerase III subunit delta [Nitrospirota bacterium]
MSYRAFLDEAAKGLPSRNYLLSSSEPFLHSEAAAVIKALVPDAERDFNLQVYDLLNLKDSSLTLDQILDELNTVPFFSGKKHVLMDNSHKLLKKDLQKLERYLQHPPESTVLVLMYEGAVKKEAKELLKGLKQISLDIKEDEIPVWLKAKAEGRGIQLSREAIDYLIGTIGSDLGLLSSELEKCSLIGKPQVEKEDIAGIIEGKRSYNAFALIDAIRARDRDAVFRIYRILRETEEPYSLLGALNWQYSRFVAEKNSPQDRRYYCEVFRELNRADRDIKSSGSPYPMELLLVKLLQLSRRR